MRIETTRSEAAAPEGARGTLRLNLAPRLRADETLSSWLERLAGAYAMTPLELLRWFGYRCTSVGWDYGRLDLDVDAPLDLPRTLAEPCGTSAEEIAAHRLPEYGTLSINRRLTFCPSCWSEDGPYRRREWANAWSMICIRHRQLLSERPWTYLSAADHRALHSWLAFYDSPGMWRSCGHPWDAAIWQEICAAFEVEPRREFLRTWRWFLELHSLGSLAQRFPRINPSHDTDPCEGDLRVKRDLTLYALSRFFYGRSLLKTLVPSINECQLIRDSDHHLCDQVTPNAPLKHRLLACLIARRLWERLTQRVRWRHARVDVESYLADSTRTRCEEWWLEVRIRSWPPHRQAAARQLFRRTSPWLDRPIWSHCCESCLSAKEGVGGDGQSVRLPQHWVCPYDSPMEQLLHEQAVLNDGGTNRCNAWCFCFQQIGWRRS